MRSKCKLIIIDEIQQFDHAVEHGTDLIKIRVSDGILKILKQINTVLISKLSGFLGGFEDSPLLLTHFLLMLKDHY